MDNIKYESLNIPWKELRISNCLPSGQSFSWRKISTNSFVGILGHRVFQLKELANDTLYRCIYDGCKMIKDEFFKDLPVKKNKIETKFHKIDYSQKIFEDSTFYCCKSTPHEHIRHYLNLDYNWEHESNIADISASIKSLDEAYLYWSESDQCILSSPRGIRLLNIDPIEALFVGVITANNNIQRITLIIEKIRKYFGSFLCKINDQDISDSLEIENSPFLKNINEEKKEYYYYSFPSSLQILNNASEEILREKCGVGYRAKSIILIAKELNSNFNNEKTFIEFIKSLDYTEATSNLQKFHGIGRKVADFVLLSGFGFNNAVPIDTHIFKYICKNSKNFDNNSILDKKRYNQAGIYFRKKFKFLPGWAQLVLFSSSVLK